MSFDSKPMKPYEHPFGDPSHIMSVQMRNDLQKASATLRKHIKPTGTIKIAVSTGVNYSLFLNLRFSLEARARYKELTGTEVWNIADIQRDDKALIQVIEELGKAVTDGCGSIRIVEVPEDTNWTILDFDGLEIVVDKDRVWRGHD